jgi:hypothetical protein
MVVELIYVGHSLGVRVVDEASGNGMNRKVIDVLCSSLSEDIITGTTTLLPTPTPTAKTAGQNVCTICL